MQDRLGPNRVGPAGLLQPIADLLKFIFKEDVIPGHVHKTLYVLAPLLLFVPSLVVFAVVPYGRGMAIADLNIGILLVFAVASLGVFGITIGGWASNSKYPLLSSLRASAQLISYEIAVTITLVSLVTKGVPRFTELSKTVPSRRVP